MTHRGDNGYLATRLTRLFDEMRRPDGKPYTLRQVADGVNVLAGQKLVSFEYLSLLRAGKRQNPRLKVVVAIACWFGVKTDYFSSLAAEACLVSDSNGVPRSVSGT